MGIRLLVRAICWSAFLWVLALLPAGCAKDHLGELRGPGFDERSREFTSEIPAREDAGTPFTFSNKAREIERNFGFQ